MSKYYLFLDAETTGTDPSSDALLELAWFITNEHYEIVSEPRTHAVHIDEGTTIASLSAMSEYVRDMHTTTGLLEALEDGATLDFIFRELAGDIEEYVATDDVIHIAGFSIHFDVDFLKANDFDSLFRDFYPRRPGAHIHHRHLDLSSVKMAMEDAGLTDHIGYDENPFPHRALPDCLEALAYARRVKGFLGLIVPFQPVGAEQDILDDLDPDVVTVDLTKYEGDL
jgi:oligoribonuclease